MGKVYPLSDRLARFSCDSRTQDSLLPPFSAELFVKSVAPSMWTFESLADIAPAAGAGERETHFPIRETHTCDGR